MICKVSKPKTPPKTFMVADILECHKRLMEQRAMNEASKDISYTARGPIQDPNVLYPYPFALAPPFPVSPYSELHPGLFPDEYYHSYQHVMKPPHFLKGYYGDPPFHGGFLYPTVKRKGGQVRFTPHQTQCLEKRFLSNKYLSPEERRSLAMQLHLSDRQVKTWFQNRRAKFRRTSLPPPPAWEPRRATITTLSPAT